MQYADHRVRHCLRCDSDHLVRQSVDKIPILLCRSQPFSTITCHHSRKRPKNVTEMLSSKPKSGKQFQEHPLVMGCVTVVNVSTTTIAFNILVIDLSPL